MSHRIITLVGTAVLGSVLIGTVVSAAPVDRHSRGHHVGYAGPVASWSRTRISVPIPQETYRSWPEGDSNYHGANGG